MPEEETSDPPLDPMLDPMLDPALEPMMTELRAMWTAHDPVPEGLADRALVAIETDDLDAEYELLHLVQQTHDLQGARSLGDAITIAFAGATFSLLLRVSPLSARSCRVDGWVTPAEELRVSAQQKRHTAETSADTFGRFAIPRLRTGLTRFWLSSPEGTEQPERLFSTPTVEL